MTKTLADYANEAKNRADAERGKRDYYEMPFGREAHLRILEWPGHQPCWIEYYVHYMETREGKRVLTCGDDNCYTCQRLADLATSPNKSDTDFAKDTKRKLKIFMYVLDWDNLSKGPQLWEPKNTQNCPTWSTLITLFTSPDYAEKVFMFKHGLLINLTVVKESRKLKSGTIDIAIQKSCFPGTAAKPVEHSVDKTGNHWIRVTLPNGQKQIFKLPDLSEMQNVYDEKYHRECWGDEPAPEEQFTPAEEAPADLDFGGESSEGGETMFGETPAQEGEGWGEPPAEGETVQADLFENTAEEAAPTPPPAPPTPQKPKTAPKPATQGKPAPPAAPPAPPRKPPTRK